MNLLILTACFWLALAYDCQAQSLNLDNLVAFRLGNYELVNETVLPKSWVFKGSKDTPPEDGNTCVYQEAMWVFEPISSQEAHSFLAVYKGPAGFDCPSYVTYQTLDIAAYKSIKASILKYKMRSGESRAFNDGDKSFVETVYEGATTQILVSVCNQRNLAGEWKNMYSFTIYPKGGI